MPRIRVIEESAAEGRTERLYAAARDRAGGVANIVSIMGLEPRSAQASMQFYATLMKTPNGLSAPRREMLAAVVSHANDCFY